MYTDTVLLDVPIDNENEVELWVDVQGEIILAQDDVGVEQHFELMSVITPNELKDNELACNYLHDTSTIEYIETQLTERLL